MTEPEVITSAPIESTDPRYIGCYTDMTSDRVLTAALTMADLTPQVRMRGDFGGESVGQYGDADVLPVGGTAPVGADGTCCNSTFG